MPITITRTNQGSTSNADYSGVPTSLIFNSGDTEKTFTFIATDDSADDDGESVKLAFDTLPTGVSAGTHSETTVNITGSYEQSTSYTVSYEQSSYTVSEGSSVTVKVTLSAAPERTVPIPIAKTNQGSTSNADYSGVPTSLIFNSGDTEKSFTFTAALDDEVDDGESVIVGFGTLPTRVSAGTHYTATVIIQNGDSCGEAGRNGREMNYRNEQVRESRKVFGPRFFLGHPEGDLLRWKEPILGIYSLRCYRVEIRTRGKDDSNYGAWEEFAAAVYDPPPLGNWVRINLGPRPNCTDRQYRVRLVYKNGQVGPWANSTHLRHWC